MSKWAITYWDGGMLRQCTIYCDVYSMWSYIQNSSASSYMYAILKIERMAE